MKTLPTLIEKAFLLKKTSLFEEINLDDLLAIADNLDAIEMRPNTDLFKEGQPAQHMYIITDGSVEILDSTMNTQQVLHQGDFFGDKALFGREGRHTCHARAQTYGHLLAITKKQLTAIIGECPSVAIRLLEAFAKSL